MGILGVGHSIINVGGEAMHWKEMKKSIDIKRMALNVNAIRLGGDKIQYATGKLNRTFGIGNVVQYASLSFTLFMHCLLLYLGAALADQS